MTGQINYADEEIRILCVDDERNVLRALQRIFLDEDYEIITAESAEEGLELLAELGEVQLVISDYRMPGKNGVDFLREVYQQRPETVRIVLSGYADAGAIVAAINEGQVYKFIPKPWNDDDLKVTLENAIERYYLHKRNDELMAQLQQINGKLQQINENLEQLVEERTAKLSMQNQALRISQNILDALPVGVLGFDSEGTIVAGNSIAGSLLGLQTDGLVGLPRDEFLPEEVNALVENLGEQELCRGSINGDGLVKPAWVTRLQADGQEGFILTIAPQSEKR